MTLNARAFLFCTTLAALTVVVGTNASWIEERVGRVKVVKAVAPAPEGDPANALIHMLAEPARTENVDLSFLDGIRQGRHYSLAENPIFSAEAGSLDVLLIGDSSVSWNLMRPLIEQRSGLRVGLLAYEGLTATKDFADLLRLELLQKLKPDGLLLLSFSDWNWSKPASETLKHDYLRKRSEALVDGISSAGAEDDARSDDRKSWSERLRGLVGRPFSRADVRAFTARRDARMLSLPHLTLPSLDLYSTWVEPVYAPRLAAKKAPAPTDQHFMLYGHEALVRHSRKGVRVRPHRDEPSSSDLDLASNIVANGRRYADLWPNTAIVIPLCVGDRVQKVRAMARTIFPSNKVIDLAMLLPPGEEVEFSDSFHLVNTGGFRASIVLGQWLKEHATPAAQVAIPD